MKIAELMSGQGDDLWHHAVPGGSRNRAPAGFERLHLLALERTAEAIIWVNRAAHGLSETGHKRIVDPADVIRDRLGSLKAAADQIDRWSVRLTAGRMQRSHPAYPLLNAIGKEGIRSIASTVQRGRSKDHQESVFSVPVEVAMRLARGVAHDIEDLYGPESTDNAVRNRLTAELLDHLEDAGVSESGLRAFARQFQGLTLPELKDEAASHHLNVDFLVADTESSLWLARVLYVVGAVATRGLSVVEGGVSRAAEDLARDPTYARHFQDGGTADVSLQVKRWGEKALDPAGESIYYLTGSESAKTLAGLFAGGSFSDRASRRAIATTILGDRDVSTTLRHRVFEFSEQPPVSCSPAPRVLAPAG